MICVIQRVIQSSVKINNQIHSQIGTGLNILLGIEEKDTEKDAMWMIEKIINLRIFSNKEGKFDFSLKDINGEVLIISQFTLLANCAKGRRPDFTKAMKQKNAIELYDNFVKIFKEKYAPEKVKTGVFQAEMEVDIKNDGPVTLILNTME